MYTERNKSIKVCNRSSEYDLRGVSQISRSKNPGLGSPFSRKSNLWNLRSLNKQGL